MKTALWRRSGADAKEQEFIQVVEETNNTMLLSLPLYNFNEDIACNKSSHGLNKNLQTPTGAWRYFCYRLMHSQHLFIKE